MCQCLADGDRITMSVLLCRCGCLYQLLQCVAGEGEGSGVLATPVLHGFTYLTYVNQLSTSDDQGYFIYGDTMFNTGINYCDS